MKITLQLRILACISGCGLVLSCSPPPPPKIVIAPPEPELSASVEFLSPKEALAWMETHSDALIIDVREESEFLEHGRLPGATNLSQLAGEQILRKLDDEPRDRPILIYCALGARSEWFAADLEATGFKNLHLLQGGLHAWKDAGLPLNP